MENSKGEQLLIGTKVRIAEAPWQEFCSANFMQAPNPGIRRVMLISKEGVYRLDIPLWWWRYSELEIVR
jgi:hypothetical protein